MQVLSPDESRRLMHHAEGNRLEALYVLALTTGMRQGELLGLQWTDLDLDNAALNIVRTLHQLPGGFTFTEPKTARSRRQILLTKTASAALRRHRALQAEDRLKAGPGWQDQDLVFTTGAGGPLGSSHVLRQQFYPLLDTAGLPRIRFHDLRHTAATLLLGQGIHPKIVSEMLGHSNIAITMDLYSHVTPTMQREAVEALESLLVRG
jgi:integrase